MLCLAEDSKEEKYLRGMSRQAILQASTGRLCKERIGEVIRVEAAHLELLSVIAAELRIAVLLHAFGCHR